MIKYGDTDKGTDGEAAEGGTEHQATARGGIVAGRDDIPPDPGNSGAVDLTGQSDEAGDH